MTTNSLIIRGKKMLILKGLFFEDTNSITVLLFSWLNMLLMGMRNFSFLLVCAWGGMMQFFRPES